MGQEMGKIGRYKYCTDDNCSNMRDRHYHADGKIYKLTYCMRYCSKCGEYRYKWHKSKKILDHNYTIIVQYEHCYICHKLYKKGVEHKCGTTDKEDMPDFYIYCPKCQLLYEKTKFWHKCEDYKNEEKIDAISIQNILTYKVKHINNDSSDSQHDGKFSPIEDEKYNQIGDE